MKLLWVDDDSDMRKLFAGWCGRRADLDATVLSDGEEALPLLATGDVSVIVSDSLGLGGKMSGFDLLQRAAIISPPTLRLVCSARDEPAYLEEMLGVAHAFFPKVNLRFDALGMALMRGPSAADLAHHAAERTDRAVDDMIARLALVRAD